MIPDDQVGTAETAGTPSVRPRSRRGFAAMDPEKQREIARKGGRASGGRPENLRGVDRRAAGRKGGQAVVDKYGPSHMAEIGRKGGRSSGGFARMDPELQRQIAARGGRAGASHDVQEGGKVGLETYGHDTGLGRRAEAVKADDEGTSQAAS